jgi:hypothetical protein
MSEARKLALSLLADGDQIDAQIRELMQGAPDGDLLSLWDRSRKLGDVAELTDNGPDLMIYSLAEAMIRTEFQRRANLAAGVTDEA